MAGSVPGATNKWQKQGPYSMDELEGWPGWSGLPEITLPASGRTGVTCLQTLAVGQERRLQEPLQPPGAQVAVSSWGNLAS